MRSIIYAAYSKDLSVKTTTAKIQMMKQGKYVGGYAPYGYILHPTIRNKLKLDPEAAEIVRRVFDEALLGSNTSEIALGLNEDNIPTPGQYFRSNHPDKKKFSRMSEKISWTASMVYKILTSYVYTGATVLLFLAIYPTILSLNCTTVSAACFASFNAFWYSS